MVDHRAWIEFDDSGAAWIAGARTKVSDLALDHIAYGWSADELHEQFSHLSLAQIHAGLAYYYDHSAEFDRAIRASLSRIAAIQSDLADSPARARFARFKHSRDTRSGR
jgi:uncharacterized protein (DUF433 family)